MERRGTVYVGDMPAPWDDSPRFTGYWDAEDYFDPDKAPPAWLEDGPVWDNPADAIKWGRERATVVILRIGNIHYSAGEALALDEDDVPLPTWPPPDA